MGRYSAYVESSAAIAVDTAFAWLMAPAGSGAKLRRVTVGCVAGAAVPTSQQLVVGINRVSTAGTTPVAGTIGKLDPNIATAAMSFDTAFTGAPTLAGSDQFRIPFNSQSGADLPWEGVEEFIIAAGTTNGLAFVNRDNALPPSHKIVLTIEWEE